MLAPERARACAAAPPAGAEVRIADEEALIVWDAAKKQQHFIRRATFDTEAKGFAFLVPAPTKPELAEAPDAVFQRLAAEVQPKIVTKVRRYYRPGSLLLELTFGGMQMKSDDSAAAVQVLETKRVAGLDAAILRADDAGKLSEWLKDNGYAMRDELTGWLDPYVKRGWTITAFKLARGESVPERFGSSAVRMTFATERPFFPYREPEDVRLAGASGGRLLRVYFAGPQRVAGEIEDGSIWPGQLKYSAPTEQPEQLFGKAVPNASGALRLTMFEDESDPRPGTADLYFSAASDQTTVVPEPIVRTRKEGVSIPIELVGLAIGGIAIGVIIVRRRKHGASGA